MSQVHDQQVYDHVNTELRSGRREPGVWGKAMEVYGENDRRAEAAYVEMRVAQIERETRKVRVVAQHKRRAYGFNHIMFWFGWIPLVGSCYLAGKGVGLARAALPLAISLAALGLLAVTALYNPPFAIAAFALIIAGWVAVWFALSRQTNRWIAETIEPLKSMLRTVSSCDVKAWEGGERIIAERL
jgi:Flp pilus assembly protein TadB